MKLFLVTSVAVALLTQAVPALASDTRSPSISLMPMSTHVAVLEQNGCNKPAAIDGNPYFEMPPIAFEQGVTGTADVKIDLTSTGKLAKEELYGSSGNPWLDRAALLSARMTRFDAAVVNCEHVGGSYMYDVEF